MTKPRLRRSSKGWYRFWSRIRTGTLDLRTGEKRPDEYGAFERDFWVGPFDSAAKAIEYTL